MNKECTKCKEIKLIELFYTDKRVKTGKTAWCKKCTDEKNIKCLPLSD